MSRETSTKGKKQLSDALDPLEFGSWNVTINFPPTSYQLKINTPLPISAGHSFDGVVINGDNVVFPINSGFYDQDGSVSFAVSIPINFKGVFDGSGKICGGMPAPGMPASVVNVERDPATDGNWSATAQPTESE